MTSTDREKGAMAHGDQASFVGGGRPVAGPAHELLPRHVIEEYTHRSQVVRCECGWIGSSASPNGTPSAWKRHVAQFKGGKP
jgi:hypothetical protein